MSTRGIAVTLLGGGAVGAAPAVRFVRAGHGVRVHRPAALVEVPDPVRRRLADLAGHGLLLTWSPTRPGSGAPASRWRAATLACAGATGN